MTHGLHVVVEKVAPDAPWLIFGNSLMTDLRIWDGVAAGLGDRFNLLRYDQRGHGRSPVEPGPLTIGHFADDLLGVMDGAGVERGHYVGLSMSVPIGLAAYGQAPERFTGLILVDGQAKSAPTGAAFWAERMALAEAEGMPVLAAATVRRWLRPERLGTSLAADLEAMIAATPLDGFLAAAAALEAYDQSAVLARVAVPTLLVAGAEDGVMPETMRGLAAVVSNARFEAISDAGHVPVFERPEAFLAAIADALPRDAEARR